MWRCTTETWRCIGDVAVAPPTTSTKAFTIRFYNIDQTVELEFLDTILQSKMLLDEDPGTVRILNNAFLEIKN